MRVLRESWLGFLCVLAFLAHGCGDPPPPPSIPRRAALDPAPVPAPAPLQRFTLRSGASADIDGLSLRFAGVEMPSPHTPSGRAMLQYESGLVVVPVHGCARSGERAFRAEHVVDGEGSWARFVWLPAESEIAGRYGEELSLGVLKAARIGEWELVITSVELNLDDSWFVRVLARRGGQDAETVVHLRDGAEGTGTQVFGQHQIVTVRASGHEDALGCPTLVAIFENPEEEIHDVQLGDEVWLQRRARARVGSFTARYVGLGERRVRSGPHRAIVSFELSDGEGTAEQFCAVPGELEWNAHRVEVLATEANGVQIRIRRAGQ